MKNSYVFVRKAIIVIASVSILAGCASIGKQVSGPSGSKFDADAVCNHSGKSRCSPTLGSRIALTQQQITLETKEEPTGVANETQIVPLLGNYLGTVVQRHRSQSGEPGTYCGPKGTKESVFSAADFSEPVYRNDVVIDETFGRSSSAAFQADIKQALLEAKVPVVVTDRLTAEINTEADSLAGRVSNTTATFVEYRVKEQSLRRLEAATPDSNALQKEKDCLVFLRGDDSKKSNWRMFQSITGLNVRTNTVAALNNKTLSNKFKGAVSAKLSEVIQDPSTPADVKSDAVAAKTVVDAPAQDTQQAAATNLTASQLETLIKKKCTTSVPGNNLFGIDACFKSVRNSSSTGASDPYFVVLGVSYWISPRFSNIR